MCYLEAKTVSDEILTLDCKGLICPVPIARLTQAVAGLESGQRIQVYATDPGFEVDVGAWAKITGNTLESIDKLDDFYKAVITKA